MTRTAFKLIRLGALVAPAGGIAITPGWSAKDKLGEGMLYYMDFTLSNLGWVFVQIIL